MNILVVDDREENRYFLEVLFKGDGHGVQPAANGAEALERLSLGGIDVIVSDILMPVMDGFELCRKVKADEALRHIPFIIYSATYTSPEDEAFALKIGADLFIIKPCEPDVLMEAVRSVMAGFGNRVGGLTQAPPQAEEFFKLYNERLVRKLEHKVLQLEKESKALRQAEQALSISESKYRRLHKSMTDGFVYVDMQGIIRESNESYRMMLGYTEEELSRLTYQSLTPEKWHALEEDIVQGQILQKGCSDVYEKEYRKKDGTVFSVELRTFLLCNEAGEKEGMWAIVRDISKRKQAEQALKELEDQLHHSLKMETVGRLAGGVAHDFNNILSAISGYGYLALMHMAKEDPLRSNIESMLEGVDRAAHLTKDLLLFSRKQASVRKPADLNEILRNVQKFLVRVIAEDIECKMVLSETPLSVLADSNQLEQVLMNFAMNASDAMPHGGVFVVTTEQVALGESLISGDVVDKPGPYAHMTVSDTGTGMDASTAERIFEPFFTTKEVGKGTGLGLSVAYGVIKQHDGYVKVCSEPGKGTAFHIYLPVIMQETRGISEERQAEAPARGMETLLIAEDDDLLRRLTRDILEKFGYTIIEAVDGEDAVMKFMESKDAIHLLIFDLLMPKMTGKAAYQEIRKIRPDMKAIFTSGYAPDQVREKALLANGQQLISKPFSPFELLKKVRSMLDEAKECQEGG